MRIAGGQIYVFTSSGDGLRAVGSSSSCSLDVSAEPVELCAKGSAGRRYRPGRISWSVTTERFLSFADDGGMLADVTLIGQPITVAVSVLKRALVEAGVDPDTLSPDETATLVGEAVVTEIAPRGSKGTVAACVMTLQGSGILRAQHRDTDGFIYTLPIIFRE